MKNVEQEVWKRISCQIDSLWRLKGTHVQEEVEKNVSSTVRMGKLWNQAGYQVNKQIRIQLKKNNHE